MKVLVLGGYGFIGLAITRELLRAGYEAVGLGRAQQTGQRLCPQAQWLSVDIAACLIATDWVPYLAGIDVVINASGALQSGGQDNLFKVQSQAICALIEACEKAGLKRYVQISAAGAELDSSTEFMRTKAQADTALARSKLDHVILRPSLVVGHSAYGGTALLRMLSAMPLGLMLAHPNTKIQTVALEDVATAARRAADGAFPNGTDVELSEPHSHRLDDIVRLIRSWLGFSPPKFVLTVPHPLVWAASKIADGLSYLGWRSPLRSTAMRIMSDGVLADVSAWQKLGEAELSSLPETLANYPTSTADRWFANLLLLFPIIIAGLSVFWILSGVIGLLQIDRAMNVLGGSAISAELAKSFVIIGSVVDILLGLTVLTRPWAKRALIGMVMVSVGYLLGATIFVSDLWADPMGPLVKVLPSIILAVVAIPLLETR